MAKKLKISDKYQVWINARKKYRLSHAQIQMARELGMNPKRFGKKANHKQEPWKAPLPVFIENLYFKRFAKRRPDKVHSIEQLVKKQAKAKAERRKRKQLKKQEPPCQRKAWDTNKSRHNINTDQAPRLYQKESH